MGEPEPHEVYAIRFATDPNWPRWKSYVHDESPDEIIRMDFFSWLAVSRNGAYVIDTGCSESRLQQMRHDVLQSPIATLKALGVRSDSVEHLIATHLHYDHIGNADQFPNATIHLQQKELSFATGPYMRFHCFRRPYFVDDLNVIVRQMHRGRVLQHNGTFELAPGLSMHLVGGHTMGQQVVRVFTKRGWIVLASDAVHYYREIERSIPWSSNAFSVGEMMDAHDIIRSLADSTDHIVPAHDPLVLKKYPAVSESLVGLAVRLHEAPMRVANV